MEINCISVWVCLEVKDLIPFRFLNPFLYYCGLHKMKEFLTTTAMTNSNCESYYYFVLNGRKFCRLLLCFI